MTRVLDHGSYRQALMAKLLEEAREASDASTDQLAGELADVLEVIKALATAIGLTWHELLALTAAKHRQRGGFQKRILLEYVEERRMAQQSDADSAADPACGCP